MRALMIWTGLVLIALTVTSCAGWRETYLETGLNQATQDSVVKEFGPPHLSRELTTGESVWSYGFNDGVGCTVYILTFDRDKVLRTWQWQRC
jgi:hypothetical protein